MTGRHGTWDGADFHEVEVPVSGSENVMVPVIRAVVRAEDRPRSVLLQRRGDVSEPVYGRLEIPGGRWRSGESPIVAVTREVREETGVEITSVAGVSLEAIDDRRTIATIRPLAIVAGIEAAFPAIHVVLTAVGRGTPRSVPGESLDVRWWRIDEVERRMREHPDEFIPSSLAALRAYVATLEAPPGDG